MAANLIKVGAPLVLAGAALLTGISYFLAEDEPEPETKKKPKAKKASEDEVRLLIKAASSLMDESK